MKYYALHIEAQVDYPSPFAFLDFDEDENQNQITSNLEDITNFKKDFEETFPRNTYTIISFEVNL